MEYPHVNNRLIRDLAQLLKEFLVKFPYFCFQSHSHYETNEMHYIIAILVTSSSSARWMQLTYPIIQFFANKNAVTQPRCYCASHLAYIKRRTCFPSGDFSLIFSVPPPQPPTRRPIRTIRSAPPPFVLLSAFPCKW